jgi:hypothetical protein
MTCNHLGTKKFCGNFEAYLAALEFNKEFDKEEAYC